MTPPSNMGGEELDPDAGHYDEPDDGLDEDGNFLFECAAYWTGRQWHCPMAGTEDCDWECTETFGDEPGEPDPAEIERRRKP